MVEVPIPAEFIAFEASYGESAIAVDRARVGVEDAEAKAFIETYFERFHGVRTYLDSMIAMVSIIALPMVMAFISSFRWPHSGAATC